MRKHTFSFVTFLLALSVTSCSGYKKTIIQLNETSKVTILEKYGVKNDSVIFYSRPKRNTLILIKDSIEEKKFIFEEYRKGKLMGKKYVYNSEGQLLYYAEYKNGVRHGYQYRSINGIPYSISRYKNGKEEYTGIQLNITW